MDRPKRRKGVFVHKVQCANCGDFGYAEISKKTGKILSKNWWYWGKLHNPARDKYYYRLIDSEAGFSIENSKREQNPDYNPKARRYLGEYWEDRKCFSKAGSRRFKIKSANDDE